MKILDNGIAIIETDTHISKWVKESGRLDHDQYVLPVILQYIKPGDTVIDAGAYIGDHTIAYERAVGSEGKVIAFEPNPVAFECLEHNCTKAIKYNKGLSDHHHDAGIESFENAGMARIDPTGKSHNFIRLTTIDSLDLTALDFFKLDVEGFEIPALTGAKKTIEKFKPVMWIEINKVVLEAQGYTKNDLLEFIHGLGYVMTPYPPEGGDQYDVLCLPK